MIRRRDRELPLSTWCLGVAVASTWAGVACMAWRDGWWGVLKDFFAGGG